MIYKLNHYLRKFNTWHLGGLAEKLFIPNTSSQFIEEIKKNTFNKPMICLGLGSNVLIRDGGMEGVVVRLGRAFAEIHQDRNLLICGAAALDVHPSQDAVAPLPQLRSEAGRVGGGRVQRQGRRPRGQGPGERGHRASG